MKNLVFIIDDDDDVREVMCFALEFEGIKTLSFSDAVKATEYLRHLTPSQYPQLIVVDFMMPEMNGIEFIEHLRTHYPKTLARIPLALSTARDDIHKKIPAEVKLLAKPIDLGDFLGTVKGHLETPVNPSLSLSSYQDSPP